MFEQLVWATDGSENADRALDCVKSLVKNGTARVLAVHVNELTVGRAGGYPVLFDEDEMEQKIRRQVDDLKHAGVDVDLRITPTATGGAALVLADAAADMGADVIVVGTRGQGSVKGLLLGSVTQRLLQVAPCPVLAVPHAASTA